MDLRLSVGLELFGHEVPLLHMVQHHLIGFVSPLLTAEGRRTVQNLVNDDSQREDIALGVVVILMLMVDLRRAVGKCVSWSVFWVRSAYLPRRHRDGRTPQNL